MIRHLRTLRHPLRDGGFGGTPQILISGRTLVEGSAEDTLIGNLSVSGVTGSPVFSLVDGSSNKAKLTSAAVKAGSSTVDYDAGTHSFTIVIGVANVTPTIPNTTFTIEVTNVVEDTTPVAFDFGDFSDTAITGRQQSNIITLSGVDGPCTVSPSGTALNKKYSLNGAAFSSSAPATMVSGDTLQLECDKPTAYSSAVTFIVSIGGNVTSATADTMTVTSMADPVATPATFIGYVGGQSLGDYLFVRGTPRVAINMAKLIRGYLGYSTSGVMTSYSGGSFVHDGSSILATNFTTKLVNGASGGSAMTNASGVSGGQTAANNYWFEDNLADGPLMTALATLYTTHGAGNAFYWSQGTTDAGWVGSDGTRRAAYKAGLMQVITRVRQLSGIATYPFFIAHHTRHQTDADPGNQAIREIQAELVRDVANVYLATTEFDVRRAVVGTSTVGATNGNNILTMADTSAFSVNMGLEHASLPVGAYVSTVNTNVDVRVSYLVNGVVTAANYTGTTGSTSVYRMDNVHPYPGSDGVQPLDTAGATTHDGVSGFYAISARAALKISQVLGASVHGNGPSIAALAVGFGDSTIDLTIAHDGGTDITVGDITGWRVELEGVAQTIDTVSRVNATTIRLTMHTAITSGVVKVYYAYGGMNKVPYTQFVYDNASPVMPLKAAAPDFNTVVQVTVGSPTYADLLAAMAVQPDGAHDTAYQAFIASLQAAGLMNTGALSSSLLDGLYIFGAHDSQAGLLNWITPGVGTGVVSGTLTFTADRGYTGNGVDGKMLLSTPLLLSQNSAHAGALGRTNTSNANSDLVSEATARIRIRVRTTTSSFVRVMSATNLALTAGVAMPGYVCGVRRASGAQLAFSNGVADGSDSVVSTGSLGGAMAAFGSTANNFADRQLFAVHYGAALSNQNITDLYAALHTLAQALGAMA